LWFWHRRSLTFKAWSGFGGILQVNQTAHSRIIGQIRIKDQSNLELVYIQYLSPKLFHSLQSYMLLFKQSIIYKPEKPR
jgi:hypothetical protein